MNDDEQHGAGLTDDDAFEPGVDDRVIAALGAADPLMPPASLRHQVLAHAASRPRRSHDPVDPRDLYRSRCDALRSLLGGLTDADWAVRAHPYDWSVHGLLAHLLQIERHTASVIGAAPPWPQDATDHLATGAAAIGDEVAREPAATLAAWAESVELVAAHLAGDDWHPRAPAPLHGLPFDRASMLIARSFEIWTHADDVCRATGRPLTEPSGPELRTMSSASVVALPFLVTLAHPGRTIGPTRIVLTGDGGGTFDLGAGRTDTDVPDAPTLLVADVVDYCRVAARRIAPADLVAERQGDQALIDDLLVAAATFAV